MDAVTHSNEEIIQLITQLFIPVRIDSVKESELSKLFRVDMTPVYIAADSKQKAHHRWAGFSRAEDFKQTLRVMRAAFDLDRRDYNSAIEQLSAVVESPRSLSTPDALYLFGVAKYKKSGDFQQAVEEWRRLKLAYPNHPLLKKVEYAL